MIAALPPVLAAGAVCWRLVDGKARVLVVYRASHTDFSLPKGKVDPGETLPETAVREIREETGLGVTLGPPLGTVDYPLPGGREKVVHYWSAEVDDHALELSKFISNDEIAALEWMPVARARKKLTYPHDLDVLDRFEALLESDSARTFAIIAVRHGTAVPPSTWDGPDSTRPLMHRGSDQAVGIARGIAAFAPEKIISSTAARCLATVAPLAALTGLEVKASEGISQDSFESGVADLPKVVSRRLKKRVTTVLCSHGPVLPRLISQFAIQAGTGMDDALRAASSLDTGEFTILHFSRTNPSAGIVAVETHSSA
ncbi:NUDIX domain-containing protein [Salinibacterium sp.]|uniref:NUDIX hydrolase n=1 Tax=Salinibacterium sp. TaxID=1915057 RepID=UPI00286BEBA0|nr:NUDIX domain-containing protein [Salinibacterium sp.]